MNQTKSAVRVLSTLALGLMLAVLAYLLASLAAHDAPAVLQGIGSGNSLAESVVVVAAELIGAVVAAWLSLGVFATVAAYLLGLRIRVPLLPKTVRHLVAGMLGVSVALGAAVPANATSPSATPSVVATQTTGALDPGWVDTSEASAPSGQTPKPTVPNKPAVTSTPSAPSRPAPPSRPAADVVVVRSGDTLWDIAEQSLGSGTVRPATSDVAREWPKWFRANQRTIGPNPDVIIPGMKLSPPKPAR